MYEFKKYPMLKAMFKELITYKAEQYRHIHVFFIDKSITLITL